MQMPPIKSQIRDEISAVKPCDNLEKAHIADALSWIASGANIFRIKAPDKPPKHLVAYFVLIDPAHNSLLLANTSKRSFGCLLAGM